jgi:hypothetical protein
MRQPSIDLRPSRLDIEALLKSTSLHPAMCRALVDALEERALLCGSEAPSDIPLDAKGRLSTGDLDLALAKFDEQTRTTVKAVLLQVGAFV